MISACLSVEEATGSLYDSGPFVPMMILNLNFNNP